MTGDRKDSCKKNIYYYLDLMVVLIKFSNAKFAIKASALQRKLSFYVLFFMYWSNYC